MPECAADVPCECLEKEALEGSALCDQNLGDTVAQSV